MRVVVDTNVWVSGAILPSSVPGQVVDAARNGRFDPVLSWELAREILEVIIRPKVAQRLVGPDIVPIIAAATRLLVPDVEIDIEIRDPHDRPVVAAAVAANADAIVTGDHDLIEDEAVTSWLAIHRIDVLTPSGLLDRLKLRG